ncbi:hypothetical protein ACIQ9L_44975, partial [Streptomyces sp. NPDC094468]
MDEVTAELYGVAGHEVGALASAYLRARDADPKSSYGDFAAVSHPVDDELAELLVGMVCDGIVAPGYAPGTVERLSKKKNGRFLIMEADDGFVSPREEAREVFGLRLAQQHDEVELSASLLRVADDVLPETAVADLLLGLAVLRYTQSNSVCYLRGGMTWVSAPASSPGSTAPVWPAPRPIPGGSGATPSFARCPSGPVSGARTGSTGRSASSKATSRRRRPGAWRRHSPHRPENSPRTNALDGFNALTSWCVIVGGACLSCSWPFSGRGGTVGDEAGD